MENVHRIVATAFLGTAPSNEYVVMHIDLNNLNNIPNNLMWVNRFENLILNDVTRLQLEKMCKMKIYDILNDITILENKILKPSFNWIKKVSKEETLNTLEKLKKFENEIDENKYLLVERLKNLIKILRENKENYLRYYPLEPKNKELTLTLDLGKLHYDF